MGKETRVVVTGMGVISPVGNDLSTFWSNIKNGVSGVGPLTRCDTTGLESLVSAEVKDFDPTAYFEVKQTKRMALFSQYAVAAAKDAWRDAGFEGPAADPERTAVIIGNGIGGREVDHDAHKILFNRGAKRISPLAIPKLIINEAAGNISMALQAKGPAHTVVSACASGTDAIGTAIDALRAGRADVVITGGTEAAITPVAIGGFCALGALSTKYNDTPEKACRPFDANRDGFIMGEGAGMLIIETREHAQARGARIYAELAGYGGTTDAFHLTAPDPSGAGAAQAILIALQDAGLTPGDIDYFNAHGTSTPLNDPMETQAIKLAFGDEAKRLKVSSTKSMTGHMIAAAGAVEAIVSILAIRDGFYPPTINYETPDPACDLDYVPNVGIAGPIRAAVSTSLGFGGHNGALVIKRFESL